MIIFEEKKEENLLGGFPVVESFFKDDEVLHYDKINKQWIAKSITVSGGNTLESQIDAATAKTPLVDTDTFPLTEPTTLKKTLWSTIKSTLKTYFDSLYALTGHTHATLHTQGTDTALGALSTKNPPIDADKAIYRDSTASDALVTSTWTQIKAFLKTYFDGIYQAALGFTPQNHTTVLVPTEANVDYGGESIVILDATNAEVSVALSDGSSYPYYTVNIVCTNSDNGASFVGTLQNATQPVSMIAGQSYLLKQISESGYEGWYIVGSYN